MTIEQCQTCATITAHCQDEKFQHLERCSCLDYEEYAPFPVWIMITGGE